MNRQASTALGLLVFIAASTLGSVAYGQVKGDGSLRLEYQYIRTGEFDSSIGKIDIGHTDGHTVLLSLDYAVNDRWTMMASLPWIRKRHRGATPHNPTLDITEYTPSNLTLVDDGAYHSNFQDLYIGVRYLAKRGSFSIEPHISYGTPTNDYQFYAHAAVGRNLWHLPVGASFSYLPPFSDFYFNLNASYVFTQKTLGTDISHFLVTGRVGYYLTPRIVPNIFFSIKHGTEGLEFPDDYDLTALNDRRWYHHDRMIKHNFINAGVGLDWVVNDRYLVSFATFKMVRPDQVNIVDRAWTAGVTRHFTGKRR